MARNTRVPTYLPIEQYEALDEIIEGLLQEWTPLQKTVVKGIKSVSPLKNKARRSATEVANDMKKWEYLKKRNAWATKHGKPVIADSLVELDNMIERIAFGTD